MRLLEAKEQQVDVHIEEDSVTFDLQNTNIDLCLAVSTSRIKKVFDAYVRKLCRSAFYVFFYLCFPAVALFLSCSVFYFVRIEKIVSDWIRARSLWGGICPLKGGLSSPSS